MYTNRNETRNSADLRKLMGFKLSNVRFQSHYQLISDHGNPRRSRQCLAVVYSNIAVLIPKISTKYLESVVDIQIDTQKPFTCLQEPQNII